MHIPMYIKQLLSDYKEIYKKNPRGFNFDEWNGLKEYATYLDEEINKVPFRKRLKYIIVNKKEIILNDEEVYPVNEQIAFYEENVNILEILLDKLNYAINKVEYTNENIELNYRQNECIRKFVSIFTGKDNKKDYIKHIEAFYELTEFIYNPNLEHEKLSLCEIENIRMMASYLLNKASNKIYELNGDEYKGRYKLKKKYSSINKIYYDLTYRDQIVGRAWIRKRLSRIKKGMYLYIEPKFREKGYGTIFYDLLARKMAEKDIDFIILKVNKYDRRAVNFLNKKINEKEFKFNILNTKIFIDTLIIDG